MGKVQWTRSPPAAPFAFVALGVIVLVVGCGSDDSPSASTSTAAATTEQAAQTTASTTPPTSPATSTALPTTVAPATTTTIASLTDPLEVATAWIAAFEAGDVAGFQALMHPDAVGHCANCGYARAETPYFAQIGEATADVADSRLLALGNGSLNAACTADGRVVTCETLRTSDFGFTTEDGEPTRQWDLTYEFTVEDGLVTRRGLVNNGGTSFDFGKVADYEDWLQANHPDVHQQTFTFGTILLTTVEQFELHQEYVPRFWASR